MKHSLSKRSSELISRSLALMEAHREQLLERSTRYMARSGPPETTPGQHDAVVRAIVETLFDNARELDREHGSFRVEEVARQHGSIGVTTKHYSCFGGGLAAIMKDVIGAEASPSLLSAWGDAYWSLVRAMMREDHLMAA